MQFSIIFYLFFFFQLITSEYSLIFIIIIIIHKYACMDSYTITIYKQCVTKRVCVLFALLLKHANADLRLYQLIFFFFLFLQFDIFVIFIFLIVLLVNSQYCFCFLILFAVIKFFLSICLQFSIKHCKFREELKNTKTNKESKRK